MSLAVQPTIQNYVDQPVRFGDGATMMYPSDRYPYTVIHVEMQPDQVTPRYIVVQHDKVIYEQGQEPRIERDPDGHCHILRFKKKLGMWATTGGTPVSVRGRRYYLAPEV